MPIPVSTPRRISPSQKRSAYAGSSRLFEMSVADTPRTMNVTEYLFPSRASATTVDSEVCLS